MREKDNRYIIRRLSFVILFSSVNSSQKTSKESMCDLDSDRKKIQILSISKKKYSERVKFQWAKLTDKKLQWANLQMKWAIAHLPPPLVTPLI